MIYRLKFGDKIAAILPSGIQHWGVYSGNGMAISASKRRGVVTEETLEEFSGGNRIERLSQSEDISPTEVIARARSKIGKKWVLSSDNCQHFVNWCCHGEKSSPQLKIAVISGLAALTASKFVKDKQMLPFLLIIIGFFSYALFTQTNRVTA